MKSYNNLYGQIFSMGNLTLAWRKARKGKTKSYDVIKFEKDIERNLLQLHYELKNKTYIPREMKTFVLRDPKTRIISKSDFRDRIVHHALVNVIGHISESRFIYDSCANQKGKGTLFALKRFDLFKRKVTKNFSSCGFCLKADIRHYFQEVDHAILLDIITRKICDSDVIWLIERILEHGSFFSCNKHGMPLGNLTSQFFANIYLNELDYFVKHELRIRYYIRYVDDFVILHSSRKKLEEWREKIDLFLIDNLKLKLHPEKSKIVSLYRGVDFVGFRNFNYFRLLRKRNLRNMVRKIMKFRANDIWFGKLLDSFNGWEAYAMWSNSYNLRKKLRYEIVNVIWKKI